MPKEENPHRPVIMAKQYAALRQAAVLMEPDVQLALILGHETGHRIGAIRQLRWSDVEWERKAIRWRAENDKIGFGHTTPLTDEALAALEQHRHVHRAVDGADVDSADVDNTDVESADEAWIFASPGDPRRPVSRHLVRDWWERLARRAGLPAKRRYGWHSLRRNFASELKATPLRDLAHLGGWKSVQTILARYITPDEETQRAALAQRKPLSLGGEGAAP